MRSDRSKRSIEIWRERMLKTEHIATLERPVYENSFGVYRPVERRNGLPDTLAGPDRVNYHYQGSGQSDHNLDAQWLRDNPQYALKEDS